VWPDSNRNRAKKIILTFQVILHSTLVLNRACMVVADTEPDWLAPLPRQRPLGLRGVWVVAARCCAGTIERNSSCR
jgi:hypothetical protein